MLVVPVFCNVDFDRAFVILSQEPRPIEDPHPRLPSGQRIEAVVKVGGEHDVRIILLQHVLGTFATRSENDRQCRSAQVQQLQTVLQHQAIDLPHWWCQHRQVRRQQPDFARFFLIDNFFLLVVGAGHHVVGDDVEGIIYSSYLPNGKVASKASNFLRGKGIVVSFAPNVVVAAHKHRLRGHGQRVDVVKSLHVALVDGVVWGGAS